MTERIPPSQREQFSTAIVVPALLGLMLFDVRLRLPKKAKVTSLQTLFEGNYLRAVYDARHHEILIPSGATVSAVVNGLTLLVKDFKVRRNIGRFQSFATIDYGGQLVGSERNGQEAYDLIGGESVRVTTFNKPTPVGRTGIKAIHNYHRREYFRS